MNILFFSTTCDGGSIAQRLQEEGHDVKIFIQEQESKTLFDNIVPKAKDWRRALKWVGKDGLIVFDDVDHGKIQDRLREQGYSVFGGCEGADLLENDRQYAQEIFAEAGMQVAPIKNFRGIRAAINFIKNNKGPWVIKQNGNDSKSLNHVGYFDSGKDAIDTLTHYNRTFKTICKRISLQKKIYGVEVAVARYFNGKNWIGPIEMNIEHKKLLPGDLGPATGEMGTLAWYDENENNKLFKKTLAKLRPHLQKINYRGVIDINCIVNEEGAWPLEPTPRFGYPIVYLQDQFHIQPWGELMKAIADGKKFKLKCRKGYGIVITVAAPPLPYVWMNKKESSKGLTLFFKNNIDPEFKNIYLGNISLKVSKTGRKKKYILSDDYGYAAYAAALGRTVEGARRNVYKFVDDIYFPKMFYRNDIGLKFLIEDRAKLKRWGYIKE